MLLEVIRRESFFREFSGIFTIRVTRGNRLQQQQIQRVSTLKC